MSAALPIAVESVIFQEIRVEPIQQITNCSDRVYFSNTFFKFFKYGPQLLCFLILIFFKTIKPN
jgi:hypothetical protein